MVAATRADPKDPAIACRAHRTVQNSPMFAPSQDDVRRFFCDVERKRRAASPMTPIETQAAHWVAQHPEYADVLGDLDAALRATFDAGTGQSNPFLHLSMHLTISEQVSIDQPVGLRQACALLQARTGSQHDAHHEVMHCLGEMIWTSQRQGTPPDGERYLECVRRRATR